MELAAEGSLFEKMKVERKFSEHKTAKFMDNIVQAMVYLHMQNPPIIHRDLKPENLLMFEGEKVKITDFGWSTQSQDIRNTFCGTQEYLAPEMIKGTGHDEKLDIWTLGILLYEMVYGKTPFYYSPTKGNVRNQRKMIEQNILQGKFHLDDKIHKNTQDLIKAMLHPNKTLRPKASEILNFKFFNILKKTHKRSKSMAILNNEANFSMKEVQELRLRVADLEKINELLVNDNQILNGRVKNKNEFKPLKENENLRNENKKLKKGLEEVSSQLDFLKEELRKSQRERDSLTSKIAIHSASNEKLAKKLSESKYLSSYLFKSTKVI